MLALVFVIYKALTLRDVDAAGEGTIVVVVAVFTSAVFRLPGVTTVPLKSTHDAWQSMLAAAAVTIRMRCVVFDKLSI